MRLHSFALVSRLAPACTTALLAAPILLAGCSSKWSAVDGDGDGVTLAQGDCNDGSGDIFPGAQELWYDGVDSDCSGGSDFDKDGDGVGAVGHTDEDGVEGTDCWDDPDTIPADYTASAGMDQLGAVDVHPDADDVYYDDIDANCDGASDFDQDGDGFDSGIWPDSDGVVGDDCYDEVDLDCLTYDGAEADCTYPVSGPFQGEPMDPADIHPTATDSWYDGTDQDCAGNDDYDQDYDTFPSYEECDDTNADIYPNPSIPEVWYNGFDENCDGNDADQDGDTFLEAGYSGGWSHDMSYYSTGDCWDDPADSPDWLPINGFPALSADDVNPDADETWYDSLDQDCAGNDDFDQDADGYDVDNYRNAGGTYGDDCDDLAGDTNPGAVDAWYDNVDADCQGNNDFDQDGDGYGQDGSGLGEDCDDTDRLVSPAGTETCATPYDDDCDTDDNDLNAVSCTVRYYDGDGDTYGTTSTECRCDAAGDYDAHNSTDCDDASAGDNPAATEIVGNQDDENCDGGEICFDDDDNDGYLDATADTRVSTDTDCADANEGTDADPTNDCDDTDLGDHPGATETTGNQDDEDCDGGEICYNDDDNDNYLDATADTIVSVDTDCTDSYEGTNTDVTTDCDDADSLDHPGATETVGNQDDEDCDGGEICYNDDDNDTYLDTSGDTIVSANTSCLDAYEGTNADLTTDCDDADAGDFPGASETIGNQDDEDCDGGEICYDDDDNDGYLDATADTRVSSDADCADANEAPNTDATTDCDDTDAGDNPSATETVGNQDDEDCNGGEICYNDDDNDGYLDTSGDTISSTNTSCTDAYEGTNTDLTTDCDDADSGDHPGATETVGNQDDEDCDGGEICYDDDDNDGYLDTTADTRVSTDADCADAYEAPSTDATTDCDDTDAGDNPSATETVGNQDDEDCNGGEICYNDDDNDGYLDTSGDTIVSTNTSCLDAYEGTNTDLTTDCNDAVATIYPSATESCNDIDDDCDGTADDGLTVYYPDSDGDGNGAGTGDCSVTSGVTSSTDCDDADRYVYTGAPEMCDNQYNNCTGSGSWSTASELGEVSVNNGTTWTDITSTFSGTSSAPGSRTLASGDTLYLCGTATVYGRVSATSVDATVTAMHGSPTLDGGSTAGSAISVNGGHVNVSNLTLRHGGGTSGYGGTVYAVASSAPSASTYTVYLSSTTVWQGSASYGGGIAIDDYASVKLASTTIQANTATQQGGGIWMDTNARLETITVVNTQNAAGTYGGGIYMAGGTLATAGSFSVTSNTAATSGGGIYMAGGTATLTGTSTSAQNTFTSNTATNTSGGAIYIGGGSWTSYYNSITSNTAGGDGGGVTVAGGTATFSSTSSVSTNTAGDDGGGYYQSGGTLNIGTSHTISNNDASGIGGGAAFRGGTATFSAGTVISGNATGGAIGGGGLGITDATVALTTPSISNNDAAAGDGGGILLDGAGSLTVSGGSLSGNSAADYGGSVYIDTTGTALFTTSSSVGTTVTGGTAGLGGGNFAIYGGTVTLTSPSVTSGLADNGGGLLLDAGSLTLTNAAFSNNIATVDGGGIYSNLGTISATGLTLSNNDAAADGGGAWLGANASLAGTISGNSALDGGGLFVAGGTTTLSATTVSGNDADYGGGVAIENSGALTMSSSSIATNTALEGAGVFNVGDLTCTGGVLFLYGIYDNVAVNDGGGVKMSTGSSSFSSTLCDFGTAEVLGPPVPAVNENFADGASNDISLNDGTVVLYEDDATFVCSGTACTP